MLTLKHSLATANANEQTTAKLNKLKLTLIFGLLFILIITPLLSTSFESITTKSPTLELHQRQQEERTDKVLLHVLHSDIKRRNIVRRFILIRLYRKGENVVSKSS